MRKKAEDGHEVQVIESFWRVLQEIDIAGFTA